MSEREEARVCPDCGTVELSRHTYEECCAILRTQRDEARSQLDAVTRERDDHKAMYLDLWDSAKRHESERDQFASMLHDCENERDGWKRREETNDETN